MLIILIILTEHPAGRHKNPFLVNFILILLRFWSIFSSVYFGFNLAIRPPVRNKINMMLTICATDFMEIRNTSQKYVEYVGKISKEWIVPILSVFFQPQPRFSKIRVRVYEKIWYSTMWFISNLSKGSSFKPIRLRLHRSRMKFTWNCA